jgi:hypothetical protein
VLCEFELTLPTRYGTLRAAFLPALFLANLKKNSPISLMGKSTAGAFYNVKRRFATDGVGRNDRREFFSAWEA